jgi:hypothetical protein
MHRKIYKYVHDGSSFVDRIVVPESYRNEVLRVGHKIPLSGHMGSQKAYGRRYCRPFRLARTSP